MNERRRYSPCVQSIRESCRGVWNSVERSRRCRSDCGREDWRSVRRENVESEVAKRVVRERDEVAEEFGRNKIGAKLEMSETRDSLWISGTKAGRSLRALIWAFKGRRESLQ